MNCDTFTQNIDNESFVGHFDFVPTFENGDDFQSYVDFDSSVFNDEDDQSVTSGLCSASKKIGKSSEDSEKRSQKRSKRGRNPWTPKEDAKLMDLMKKYGQSWAMISSCLPGRSGKQVRDRYLNKLRPNIKLGDWTQGEDDLLVRLCNEVGNRWSLIANHLPGRTEGQVKNRYYSYIKKRLQPNGTLSQSGSFSNSSRNLSETSSNFAASPVYERTTFDFNQGYDFSVQQNNNNYFVNTGFAPIPPMNSFAKDSMIAQPEIYSDQETANSSIASYSPVRVSAHDPTDLISYDAPMSGFCRQFSQAPVFNNAETFFNQEMSPAPVVDAAEHERRIKLNQRKALLELALAETLNEMKGF